MIVLLILVLFCWDCVFNVSEIFCDVLFVCDVIEKILNVMGLIFDEIFFYLVEWLD